MMFRGFSIGWNCASTAPKNYLRKYLECLKVIGVVSPSIYSGPGNKNLHSFCLAQHSVTPGNQEISENVQDFNEELEFVFGTTPCMRNKAAMHTSIRPTFGLENTFPANANSEADQPPQPVCIPPYTPASTVETLTHVDSQGRASMVNVSRKEETLRTATATGRVWIGPKAFALVEKNQIAKGDVLTVAQIAGINAAKQTSALIPLCHNILLRGVDVRLSLEREKNAVSIWAKATCLGPTGVEMEALTAVSIAGLTVYDMCKAVSKEIVIGEVQLESKQGGKSEDWFRTEPFKESDSENDFKLEDESQFTVEESEVGNGNLRDEKAWEPHFGHAR